MGKLGTYIRQAGHLHTTSQEVDNSMASSAPAQRDHFESTNKEDPIIARCRFEGLIFRV
jgi:hypothetical protein